MRKVLLYLTPALGLLVLGWAGAAAALTLKETPFFQADVEAGKLPAVAERVPANPSVVRFDGTAKRPGQPGSELRTLIGRAKDIRLLVVYGYARIVGYNEKFQIVPDLAEAFDVKEGRIFTFHLRKGHKWSDGQPFTASDIDYWWSHVANNKQLSPAGPPRTLRVDGKLPKFEMVDAQTVRFTWEKANPFFLPRLAGASPLFIYRPAHYLKQFHNEFAKPDELKQRLKKARTRNWASLHNRRDNMYRFDNPALPTLQPWVNRSRPPATRFQAVRNPFYHRVDEAGHQLPYFDKVILGVSNSKLIPAKAGTGEVDLQARAIAFNNYTFLKEHQEAAGFTTHLWRIAKGAHMALFPNLNSNDPVWRKLFRDVRFRRALSLAIDRSIINEALYFGLAIEGNNTLLPESALFEEKFQKQWAEYDPETASDMLDELGLDQRNSDDIRLLPDGRPLEIIVETAGEDTEQIDVLELVRETWAEVGVKLYVKPSQREIFRNRIFAGETQMSIWSGLENGVATADVSPKDLAPTSQQQLQWPKWGQYFETSTAAGEAPDLDPVLQLMALNAAWMTATEKSKRTEIWKKMLAIHADQVFTIGIISGVRQPVVVKNDIVNVPTEGIYNWDPGAHFGIYRPDTFWRRK